MTCEGDLEQTVHENNEETLAKKRELTRCPLYIYHDSNVRTLAQHAMFAFLWTRIAAETS